MTSIDEAIAYRREEHTRAKRDNQGQVVAMPVSVAETATADSSLSLRIFKYTDSGNAERLVAKHGAEIRFCHAQKEWYVYDGRRWPTDRRGAMMAFAKDIARDLYGEAFQIADEALRKKCAEWALKSESTDKKKAALISAQSEKGIPILPEEFDRDAYLFNVLNGTIDLRNGELRAHRREDLITKLAPVAYDPDARSDLWQRFLNEATGADRELQEFLQRAVGYSLTGDVGEEKLFFVHGPGGSGKSTFLEAMKSVLGDYAKTADFECFVQRNAGGVRDDIAELAGRRFVVSIEVDEGRKLAEGLTKALTGGDTVRARFLYQQGFEFQPQFKLWLAANHAPKVKHDDSAMWRRILRIPFDNVVPKEKRDRSIKARLKDPRECGPAILAWAVEGCLRWRDEGLGVPTTVEAATEQYRLDMDPLRDFLADCCVLHPTAWIPIGRLRKQYEDYCRDRGEKRLLTPNEFAAGLRARGCESKRRHAGAGWIGIGLLADESTPPVM
jgi:putative DNA primase/helicase